MSESPTGERKDATERRVYNLPADLLERLRSYQVSQGINSEAEAARRLLHTALQMRDRVTDILNSLEARFASEKDLRVLAAEVLSTHILVVEISFDDGSIRFKMTSGDRGMMRHDGSLYTADDQSFESDWTRHARKTQQPSKRGGPSWDSGPGGDLDDEIPF